MLVIAFLAGGGLFLSFFGWDHLHTIRLLEQNPAVTEGRVVGKATRALSRGGQSSKLVVEYTPAGHAAITKAFDVDGPTYRAAVATGKARVTYLPEDPAVSLITKFAVLPFQILVGFGALMVLAGLSCLGYAMRGGAKGPASGPPA
ncbi:MAG: hypothetical protein KDH15_18465 [Rhodocyclaceae bacterium]|nr:hypothetical protein [Rhodocyclaceae bacterium]